MISNFHRKASAMALSLLITSSVVFSAYAADSDNPPSGSDISCTTVDKNNQTSAAVTANTESTLSESAKNTND